MYCFDRVLYYYQIVNVNLQKRLSSMSHSGFQPKTVTVEVKLSVKTL